MPSTTQIDRKIGFLAGSYSDAGGEAAIEDRLLKIMSSDAADVEPNIYNATQAHLNELERSLATPEQSVSPPTPPVEAMARMNVSGGGGSDQRTFSSLSDEHKSPLEKKVQSHLERQLHLPQGLKGIKQREEHLLHKGKL